MQKNNIWFDNISSSKLTSNDIKEIGEAVREAIDNKKLNVASFNMNLQKDRASRIVLVTVANKTTMLPYIYIGKAIGIANAILDAFRKVLEEKRPLAEDIIKIDIVEETEPVGKVKFNEPITIERGLEGIAFSSGSDIALLPDLIIANAILDSKGYINSDRLFNSIAHEPLKAANLARLMKNEETELFIFKTSTILIQNNQASLLYRGSRIIEDINIQELKYRLKLAASYLTQSVYPNGRFDYIYRADRNRSTTEYNIIRHAGTLYSMLEYHQAFPDLEVLEAAKRALNYLMMHLLPDDEPKNSLCLVERGVANLGGNALSSVAIAKYIEVSNDKELLPILIKLGEWMLTKLREDGEFNPQKQFYLKEIRRKSDYSSPYFPGEAILAFLRIYLHDKNPKWLDGAERAALWLINVRDKDLAEAELNHDHWLLYSLNEIHRYRPHEEFLKHTIRLCNAIFKKQHQKGLYPDWRGGFYKPPRSTPAATRAEGLGAAYFLIRDFIKDTKLLQQILETLKNSVLFQFRTQLMPEQAMYLPYPLKGLGGFHSSLTEYDIRIDFVQHNISSLVGLYKILTELK